MIKSNLELIWNNSVLKIQLSVLVWHKGDILIIISSTYNLFSPWKFAHLALNINNPLTAMEYKQQINRNPYKINSKDKTNIIFRGHHSEEGMQFLLH
jgi:hypothetical protein